MSPGLLRAPPRHGSGWRRRQPEPTTVGREGVGLIGGGRMIEGWRFNPPPHWPKPPGNWSPPAHWQPDPAWGPVPPGWQLWVAERRGPQRRGILPVAGWAALIAIVAVVVAVPRAPGPPADDPRAGGVVLIGDRRPPAAADEPRPVPASPLAPGRRSPTPTAVPTPTAAPAPSASPISSATAAATASATPSLDPNRRFRTCGDLNRVYRTGLGLPSAVDRTTGRPVTDFGRSTSLYRANRLLDQDHDGIACEPG